MSETPEKLPENSITTWAIFSLGIGLGSRQITNNLWEMMVNEPEKLLAHLHDDEIRQSQIDLSTMNASDIEHTTQLAEFLAKIENYNSYSNEEPVDEIPWFVVRLLELHDMLDSDWGDVTEAIESLIGARELTGLMLKQLQEG